MTRFVDRGAITAAWVGLGMAVTVIVSFMLVIPIESVVWPFTLLGGMMIGYYANARSNRVGGPWRRVILNALLAGLVTGLTYAVLWLGVKAIFFNADDGYRDASMGGRIECQTGADCVYRRHVAFHGEAEVIAQGVTDVDSFTTYYWNGQLQTAGLMVVLSLVGAGFGGLMYGATNRKKPALESAEAAGSPRG